METFDRIFLFASTALILVKVGGLKTHDLVWVVLGIIWLAYPLVIIFKALKQKQEKDND